MDRGLAGPWPGPMQVTLYSVIGSTWESDCNGADCCLSRTVANVQLPEAAGSSPRSPNYLPISSGCRYGLDEAKVVLPILALAETNRGTRHTIGHAIRCHPHGMPGRSLALRLAPLPSSSSVILPSKAISHLELSPPPLSQHVKPHRPSLQCGGQDARLHGGPPVLSIASSSLHQSR